MLVVQFLDGPELKVVVGYAIHEFPHSHCKLIQVSSKQEINGLSPYQVMFMQCC